jgi:hypothetical protein
MNPYEVQREFSPGPAHLALAPMDGNFFSLMALLVGEWMNPN